MTYPPADAKTQWFAGMVSTAPFGRPLEKVVWHTTETSDWPGYKAGQTAPHYTVKANPTLRRLTWRAHFPDTHHSRALRNETGGVETNRDGALQVEIVGTCDETKTWPASVLQSWDLPDWAIEGLATFVAWCHREHGIPLRAPVTWLAYGPDARRPGVVPASYGASPARFTGAQWDAFRGHCGHQHAAEQTHGDPGRLPMHRILARAQQLLAPAPRTLHEEIAAMDDKARAKLVADIAAASAAAVLAREGRLADWVADSVKAPRGTGMTLHALGQQTLARLARLGDVSAALAAVRDDVVRLADDDGLSATERQALAAEIASRVERVQVTVQTAAAAPPA